MTIPSDVADFIAANRQAVLTTFRRSGAAQMSVVTVGAYGGGAGFTTTEDRAKLRNLVRNPRCSLLALTPDRSEYVVLEGRARLLRRGESDEAELRDALRGIYRAASGSEHPDWDDYDRAMVADRRAAVIVVPEHIYGSSL